MARATGLWLTLVVACTLPSLAVRADTLRCGDALVAIGDPMYEVRSRCGEPAMVTRHVEYRSASGWVPGAGVTQTVEVVIEEWTYDFGPRQFVRLLTFEQGRLVSVVAGHRSRKKA